MEKISQKSDDFFTFYSYLLDDGQDAIEGWLSRQTPEVQADAFVAFKTLREMPRGWWRKKRFEKLGLRGQAACAGLIEIKVFGVDGDDEKEHFRILGYEDTKSRRVIMLMAFKKDDDPDYSRSCPEAQARKAKVDDEQTRARVCRL